MSKSNQLHLPRLSELLDSSGLAGSRVLIGEKHLNNRVSSIVGPSDSRTATHSLLILDSLTLANPQAIDNLSVTNNNLSAVFITVPSGSSIDKFVSKKEVKSFVASLRKSKIPVLVLDQIENHTQVLSNLRKTLSEKVQELSSRLYQNFFNAALEYGVEGIVNLIEEKLRRPVAIETVDFKLLYAHNLKSTPSSQRKKIRQFVENSLHKKIDAETSSSLDSDYLVTGKRLVFPLIHNHKTLLGFLSVNIKEGEEVEPLAWVLRAAALAAIVDLVQRSKTEFGVTTLSKSLLLDLMVGKSLAALELERLERHFEFDLYDGFFVFAVDVLGRKSSVKWPDNRLASLEAEGTRIYVYPFQNDQDITWKHAAEELLNQIQSVNKASTVQLGAARPVETILEFHEAYKQARQALIIGSMINAKQEFAIGYGDLGVMRLLYLIVDHPELEQFYKETLGPLEAYDKEWETDLTETLKVYVENGANLNSAARELFIHRHTMRYRLEQIEEDILKIDVDSQEVLLNLQIAYLIKQLVS